MEDRTSSRWTNEQVKELRKMVAAGMHHEEIAKVTGRTPMAIMKKRSDLNLASKKRPPISPAIKKRVIEMSNQGIYQKDIAKALDISLGSVSRIVSLHADFGEDEPKPKTMQMRECLGPLCRGKHRKFLSDGPGNRICPRCREYNENLSSSMAA